MTKKITQTDLAAQKIKNDIILGELRPGSQLKIQDISKRYNIGSTPIREALNKLAQTGFVQEKPLQGFFVTAISSDKIKDNIETRKLIETEAFKRAIKNGDDQWEGSVISEAHQLKKMLKNAKDYTNEEISNKSSKLWETMMSACGSPTLMKTQKKLWEQCQRYRELWWIEDLSAECLEKAYALLQNKADFLVDSLLNKDVNTAIKIINKDFDQFLDMYLQFLDSYLVWLKNKSISLNN